ncbi:type II secretion system major pseudopilin GspG [Isoalcanivorax beigongshangi]|uniref:Type II secretion system core protein G n=1 Tax=Isoalcanivorax beigongshangi TaxID=3238810 RepID=A0ABV4AGH6_9GAMM
MKTMSRRSRQQGMTLIEILVVVAIIGLIAAMIVPNVMGQSEQARVDLARSNMASIATALDMYRLQNGRYPSTEEGLRALVERPASARTFPDGGYLRSIPKDPWGTDYIYASPGQSGPFDLMSLGADGQEGGDGVNSDILFRDGER